MRGHCRRRCLLPRAVPSRRSCRPTREWGRPRGARASASLPDSKSRPPHRPDPPAECAAGAGCYPGATSHHPLTPLWTPCQDGGRREVVPGRSGPRRPGIPSDADAVCSAASTDLRRQRRLCARGRRDGSGTLGETDLHRRHAAPGDIHACRSRRAVRTGGAGRVAATGVTGCDAHDVALGASAADADIGCCAARLRGRRAEPRRRRRAGAGGEAGPGLADLVGRTTGPTPPFRASLLAVLLLAPASLAPLAPVAPRLAPAGLPRTGVRRGENRETRSRQERDGAPSGGERSHDLRQGIEAVTIHAYVPFRYVASPVVEKGTQRAAWHAA